jgi:hypothetical protein
MTPGTPARMSNAKNSVSMRRMGTLLVSDDSRLQGECVEDGLMKPASRTDRQLEAVKDFKVAVLRLQAGS